MWTASSRFTPARFPSGPLGWSRDIGRTTGAAFCPRPHTAFILEGSLGVSMDDGNEEQFGTGDVMYLPPAHDVWTVGPNVVCSSTIGRKFTRWDRRSVHPTRTIGNLSVVEVSNTAAGAAEG